MRAKENVSLWLIIILIISSSLNTLLIVREIRQIKKSISTIEREIKTPDEQPYVEIDLKQDKYKGDAGRAIIFMIEYSTYKCTHCKKFNHDVLPRIVKKYVNKGTLIFIHREYPLNRSKENMHYSQAALCAGNQGKYFEALDLMYDETKEIKLADMPGKIEIDKTEFNNCMEKMEYMDTLENNLASGEKYGVSGTPTFFVGRYNIKDITHQSEMVVGFKPIDNFEDLFKRLSE